VGWSTVASETGDIERFPVPLQAPWLGLCPRVLPSGSVDRRGPISKHGPRYRRWAVFEAALNACKHA
jgi:transposase